MAFDPKTFLTTPVTAKGSLSEPATEKQQSLIMNLCIELDLHSTSSVLDKALGIMQHKGTVSKLNKRQASKVIDYLLAIKESRK